MHQRRSQQYDAQFLVSRDGSGLVVESPSKDLPRWFFDQIALYRLRRLVENLAIAQRAAQLYIFGMCPNQRTGRTGWLTPEKFQVGDVVGIPDLLGKQATIADGAVLHHRQQGLRFFWAPRGQFVMSTFAGQQRPGAADASAVESRAILVLAVSVTVVAVPARALWQLHAQQSGDDANRIQ